MAAKRWLAMVVLLVLAACWIGCSSQQSQGGSIGPHYVKGEVKIKKITELFITDTQQAVAQLLTGDVDVIGSETLGAGAEVQTVLDAQKAGQPVQVLIEPSATWEHIDMSLFIP